MDIKKWLSRAYKIDQQIASKHEQIEMWRALAEKVTSSYSATPNGIGGHSSRVESYCIKIADAKNEIERQLVVLVEIKRDIEAAIANVRDITTRVLLEQRYLLCKGWENIAEFMGYDETYTKKVLQRRALREIKEYIPPQ